MIQRFAWPHSNRGKDYKGPVMSDKSHISELTYLLVEQLQIGIWPKHSGE